MPSNFESIEFRGTASEISKKIEDQMNDGFELIAPPTVDTVKSELNSNLIYQVFMIKPPTLSDSEMVDLLEENK